MIDISVTGLIKSFDLEKKILDGITFQIDTGERVGLLGKNGAGKTTLFRILTGELDYDAGEVSIASYMNFLIVNGAVILPQYGDENDLLAVRQVQEMFPDREVVGVQTREVAFGGGNIHCITQQQPKTK